MLKEVIQQKGLSDKRSKGRLFLIGGPEYSTETNVDSDRARSRCADLCAGNIGMAPDKLQESQPTNHVEAT